MVDWLHTLGYRGHITTKSRRYSITMTALRAVRHRWRIQQAHHTNDAGGQHGSHNRPGHDTQPDSELDGWHLTGVGHRDDGDRLLVYSAALRARDNRRLAREAARDGPGISG